VALHVLRSLEDQLLRGVTHHLAVRTRTPVALYILNQKRAHLSELEQRFGLGITVSADESIANGSHFQIERGEAVDIREPLPTSVQPDSVSFEDAGEIDDSDSSPSVEQGDDRQDASESVEADEAGGRRRRRRRRRKGGEATPAADATGAEASTDEPSDDGEPSGDTDRGQRAEAEADDGDRQRKRRRGRRGGRRGRRGHNGEHAEPNENGGSQEPAPAAFAERSSDDVFADPYGIDTTPVIEPKPQGESDETASTEDAGLPAPPPLAEEEQIAPVSFEPGDTGESADEREPIAEREPVAEVVANQTPARAGKDENDDDQPKRSGWWQRRSFF
jgi:ribonuclease E